MNRHVLRDSIRGLYGIADAEACHGDPVRGVAQLLEGGCRLVQLRCKGWSLDDIETAARQASALCLTVNAIFILNDRPELVTICNAHGVHIGQTDQTPEATRKLIGTDKLIGLTNNDPAHLRHLSQEADYMSYGPIWDSSRAGSHKTTQGIERFRNAVTVSPGIPVVAIGGLQAKQIPIVRDAGANAWAVISAVFNTNDPVAATEALMKV